MKIKLLTATALLTMLTATSASAGKLDIWVDNYSTDAIAVGDTTSAAFTVGGYGFSDTLVHAGGRAEAGSVLVDASGRACDCYVTVDVINTSAGAIAVGNASAGSTAVKL